MVKVTRKIFNLPLLYKGKPTQQIRYRGNFTRKQIKKMAQQVSNEFYRAGDKGQVMVSMKYPDFGTRSAPSTPLGEEVILFALSDYYDELDEEDEPDTIKEFSVYVLYDAPTGMGCTSIYNDCLFECLHHVLPMNEMPWKSNKELKDFLGIPEKAKIDIGHMKYVEYKLPKHKINVTGDHIYTSVKKTPHIINLEFLNSHCTLKNKVLYKKGVAQTEKNPLIYQFDDDNGHINVFDGTRYGKMSKEVFKKIKNDPVNQGYILIPNEEREKKKELTEKGMIQPKAMKTLKETYIDFCADADILKAETNGRVNLYKTGSNVNTALDLFYNMTSTINPEHIDQAEAIWIENATFSPLMWADKYEGECHKYDFSSKYPSIQASHYFLIALKAGEFKRLTQKEFDKLKFYQYGIYRCEIEESKPKLFRNNKLNYYSHIDLTRAKELNLKITLTDLEDDEPNFLYYSRDKLITGDALFGEYVKYLFPLKARKVPRSKKLVNVLWGGLCQKNVYNEQFSLTDPVKTIFKNRSITALNELSDGKYMVKYVDNSKRYETNYARLAPFLMAKARMHISQALEPNLEFVKRCHTDSMFSIKKLDIKTSDDLGQMKYEGYCKNVKIFNNIKVVGMFVDTKDYPGKALPFKEDTKASKN